MGNSTSKANARKKSAGMQAHMEMAANVPGFDYSDAKEAIEYGNSNSTLSSAPAQPAKYLLHEVRQLDVHETRSTVAISVSALAEVVGGVIRGVAAGCIGIDVVGITNAIGKCAEVIANLSWSEQSESKQLMTRYVNSNIYVFIRTDYSMTRRSACCGSTFTASMKGEVTVIVAGNYTGIVELGKMVTLSAQQSINLQQRNLSMASTPYTGKHFSTNDVGQFFCPEHKKAGPRRMNVETAPRPNFKCVECKKTQRRQDGRKYCYCPHKGKADVLICQFCLDNAVGGFLDAF
mmetsp:Transcript_16379/g.25226  ORF Transcript_16379/g.25226 Transcript_16379/m.25226 type:complete len:291 (-) Transcript_16379:274-1146(-)